MPVMFPKCLVFMFYLHAKCRCGVPTIDQGSKSTLAPAWRSERKTLISMRQLRLFAKLQVWENDGIPLLVLWCTEVLCPSNLTKTTTHKNKDKQTNKQTILWISGLFKGIRYYFFYLWNFSTNEHLFFSLRSRNGRRYAYMKVLIECSFILKIKRNKKSISAFIDHCWNIISFYKFYTETNGYSTKQRCWLKELIQTAQDALTSPNLVCFTRKWYLIHIYVLFCIQVLTKNIFFKTFWSKVLIRGLTAWLRRYHKSHAK